MQGHQKSVEKSFVAVSSSECYLGHLIRLGLLGVDLFDNRKEKFSDQHLGNMIDADNKDKAEKNKKRTAFRNYIVHAANAIKPLRDWQHHNSFIKIDVETSLDYDAVVEYMSTK